ncbi:hypothetical protein CcrSwift_gp334 [Caulobacter phage CcrSwift]|uniref:Uncharacterized protein n=1 Tax=Caulobacter phage CcrSwift TaxID=2927984 RepID=K4K7L5_9CAUD|nr:hypothetical protein D870_gp009 [Caulobacter phage CcrSwift]YP_006990067.1 hypothetical protein D870_gp087 [Caulobacter phage CcrSwift]AFU88327.1 hypothetical protein CcrSwift_gp009 [Caulobacter phage CcrSwift]AFU88652.1 hypothetical protein CcrSwift_gp334 [Caulobacter phage CcrSwift]
MLDALPAARRDALVKSSKPARNTLDYTTSDGVRRVRLHDTDVLTFHVNGAVEINTGGWNTLTTRDRINAFAPPHVRVYSDKGRAVVHALPAGASAVTWSSPAASKPFAKRATVHPDGRIEVDATVKELEAIPSLIRRYLEAFKAGFPFNSSGDPWMTPGALVAPETALDWLGADSGKPYLFDSILFHAHVAAGLTEEGAAGYMRDLFRHPARLDKFHLGRIRRYLKRCLRDA